MGVAALRRKSASRLVGEADTGWWRPRRRRRSSRCGRREVSETSSLASARGAAAHSLASAAGEEGLLEVVSRGVRAELFRVGAGRRHSLARLGRRRRRWLGWASCRGRRGLPRVGAGRRRSLARPVRKEVFLLGVDDRARFGPVGPRRSAPYIGERCCRSLFYNWRLG